MPIDAVKQSSGRITALRGRVKWSAYLSCLYAPQNEAE